jgi:hypothetical protein
MSTWASSRISRSHSQLFFIAALCSTRIARPARVLAHVVLSSIHHFEHVPTETRMKRLTDFADSVTS